MTTKTGILYLQKDRFHLYSPYLPNILEFRFVPELIRDFDVINKELLENLIKVFIANNKVPASNLIIVVADNASFIKDFVSPPVNPALPPTTPPPTLEDLQNMANQYVEQVPFETVVSKTFPLATGIRAYATNQEVYEGINSILEKQGFIIQGVYPGLAFGQEISAKSVLDGQSVGIIMQKLSMLHSYNLLKEEATIVNTTPEDEVEEKPESKIHLQNNKLTLIIAISVIMFIVMITGLILYQQSTYKPYIAPPATSSGAQSTSVAPPPSEVNSTAPITFDVKNLSVQITTVSSSATTAQKLSAALTPLGFKSITIQTQDSLATAQTLLVFSSRVPPEMRTEITTEVKKVLGEILVQEKSDAAADVVINLAK